MILMVNGAPERIRTSDRLVRSQHLRQLGRRERLPTRGSHRSGRARFGHPAPQAMVSLRDDRHCERHAAGEVGSSP